MWGGHILQPTTMWGLLQKMDKRGDYALIMEKGMATHASTPAWRIPWTGKPGRLQSMGLQRVGQD